MRYNHFVIKCQKALINNYKMLNRAVLSLAKQEAMEEVE